MRRSVSPAEIIWRVERELGHEEKSLKGDVRLEKSSLHSEVRRIVLGPRSEGFIERFRLIRCLGKLVNHSCLYFGVGGTVHLGMCAYMY